MNDLVSIIVPIYNVEKYLVTCINSIINQTYRNIEIILVDDGSIDSSPQICDYFKNIDNRIKVIHKKNGGLSSARNTGLDIANGKYISFVDSDDYVSNDFIESLYKAIINNNSMISVCSIRTVDEIDNTNYKDYNNMTLEVMTKEEAMADIINDRKIKVVVWNKLYCATIFKSLRFKINKFHEDEFLTYKIIDNINNLTYINRKLYNYRQRSGSIMSIVSIKHLDYLDAILERIKYIKNRYPSLYITDKINYCYACVNYYKDSLKNNINDSYLIKKKIKCSRNKIEFELCEIKKLSPKNIIYIVGSKYFINLMCIILLKKEKYKNVFLSKNQK